MIVACQAKKWGNSLGLIISEDVAREEGIRAGDEIVVEIKKKKKSKTILEELAGSLPFKKPVRQLIRESREGMESRHS